jgi:D-beta-D-heptose 7-phosphate kinase/D-beta-D-heptose 1-phosphate adenosyltransferase
MNKKIVAVSGGFDPIHIGHVRMIRESSEHGDVVVIANSDEWLVRKKEYVFMPFEERKEILMSIKGVVSVIKAEDDDNTVCQSLKALKPDIFANGGDRKQTNTPEMKVCEDLGIEMLWNVGGGKIQSSSWLVEKGYDYCPNCDMPLEDSEACSYCEWTRNGTPKRKQ